jgi:hypothetical protein
MALAESNVDLTKAVVRGVISDDNAKMVVHYLETNHKSICCINAVRERIVLNGVQHISYNCLMVNPLPFGQQYHLI